MISALKPIGVPVALTLIIIGLIQIKKIKETIINLGGYLTIVKKSESLSSDIGPFTINDTRLLLSQKIKESFDPKKILNPGKMYRGL